MNELDIERLEQLSRLIVEKRIKWRAWFIELKDDVDKGGKFDRGIPSGISRAMDFDGISSGRLTTQAGKISNRIREIYTLSTN